MPFPKHGLSGNLNVNAEPLSECFKLPLRTRVLLTPSGEIMAANRKYAVQCLVIVSIALSIGRASAQAYLEIDECKAGKVIDTTCMKKHQDHFEKYVISGDDWGTQRTVADALVEYYTLTNQTAAPKAMIVIAKQAAYAHAKDLQRQILKSHTSPCPPGPECKDGQEFDVSRSSLDRERELAVKQYFATLDPKLYKGEIKGLEQSIKTIALHPGEFDK
jgi:hypothetical protein